METIRILHVLYAMNFAGTETLLMNLYRNINREVIQFDFAVCCNGKGDYDQEIENMGGRIIHYPRYNGKNHLAFVKWWDSFLKTNREYRIIHGHIGGTAAIYLSVAKRNGCYTIAHSHGTYGKIEGRKDVLYRMWSFPTRWIADFFMGCSGNAIRDRFGSKVFRDPDRSRVFYNAIDAEKFRYDKNERDNIRKEFHIRDDETILGTVGRLTSAKNPFMIIDIISDLKKRGIAFRFLWIGRGELSGAIEEKLKERQLNDIVIMGGVRGDVNRVLQAMDIFVFPSLHEGLGISCVEAQAADLVCFCSDVIPPEAKITEKYIALPLDDKAKWTAAISDEIRKGERSRRDRSNDLKEAGYDIRSQAKWLEEFYLHTFYLSEKRI